MRILYSNAILEMKHNYSNEDTRTTNTTLEQDSKTFCHALALEGLGGKLGIPIIACDHVWLRLSRKKNRTKIFVSEALESTVPLSVLQTDKP